MMLAGNGNRYGKIRIDEHNGATASSVHTGTDNVTLATARVKDEQADKRMGPGKGADEFGPIVRTAITDHDRLVVHLAAFEEVGHCL